jgi:hypothetical protein
MNAYLQWVKRFLFVTCTALGVLIAFNLAVDPNGVFGILSVRGFNKHKTDVLTDRITKFYYARRFAPDTLILGTSRAAYLDPADLERYTRGRAFNLSTYASTIYQQYCFFKYMADHFEIKNLVLGLDLGAFVERKEEDQRFDEKRFQQDIYVKDYVESLLSITSVKSSFITVRDNLFGGDIRQKEEQGFREFNHPEKGLDDKYMARLKRREKRALLHLGARYASIRYNDREQIAEGLEYLRLIVQIAKEKGIACKVYISPVYWKLFDLKYAVGLGSVFEAWKKGVAIITDYYDFTGHNEITEDFRWWWDPSHITSKGGKLILARLYGDDTVQVPKDFGVLITKTNINGHLADLRRAVRPLNPDGTPKY